MYDYTKEIKSTSYLIQYVDNYNRYAYERNQYIDQTNNRKMKKLNSNIEYKDIDDVNSPKFCNYYYDLCVFLNKQEVWLNNVKKIKDQWFYLPPIPSFLKCEEHIPYVKERNDFFKTIYNEYKDVSCDFDSSKITVIKKDNNGCILKLFLLTSDVFGFTGSPNKVDNLNNLKVYPLSFYKNIANNETYENTLNILRTIGGAFLWPTNTFSDKNCKYNLKSGVINYLEDRVDLKLNEILHYYTNFLQKYYLDFKDDSLCTDIFNSNICIWLNSVGNIKGNFINSSNFDKLNYSKDEVSHYRNYFDKYINEFNREILCDSLINTPMSVWLNHFETASNYIDFFKFNEFIENSNKVILPYDITLKNSILNENDEKYYTKRIQNYLKSDINEEEKKNYIQMIVNNLKANIIKRTKAINDVISI